MTNKKYVFFPIVGFSLLPGIGDGDGLRCEFKLEDGVRGGILETFTRGHAHNDGNNEEEGSKKKGLRRASYS